MFVQVECEEDVCNALQHWVLADPLERKALFGDLFGKSVCWVVTVACSASQSKQACHAT